MATEKHVGEAAGPDPAAEEFVDVWNGAESRRPVADRWVYPFARGEFVLLLGKALDSCGYRSACCLPCAGLTGV